MITARQPWDVRKGEASNLARVDVLASADDHVLQPTRDAQITALIHRAEVARVEPPIKFERPLPWASGMSK